MSSSNIWILIGIIAGVIAAFSMPYGFYLKSHEKKIEAAEKKPHIAIEKIEKIKDIVGCDKITYNQQIITSPPTDGQTGKRQAFFRKIELTNYVITPKPFGRTTAERMIEFLRCIFKTLRWSSLCF